MTKNIQKEEILKEATRTINLIASFIVMEFNG